MLYLVIAVLVSSLVAVLMRLSEKHVTNNFAMFAANYFVCSLIAFLFIQNKNIFAPHEGLTFTLLLGLFSGCLYLTCFVLMKQNIHLNGVMLSSVFMKLGVIVPVLMAIIFFRETPTALKIVGFCIAVFAIMLIYLEPSKGGGKRGFSAASLLLLLLLLVSGLTESMANIYDKLGNAELKDNFLFINFAAAFLLSASITAIGHKKITWKDIAFGVMIGIPNYFCSRFLLLSLGSLPAFVVYPIYNVGAIVLIGLAGIFLFKERLSLRKGIGFALIILALVLLNV